jgi:hypothetical protein
MPKRICPGSWELLNLCKILVRVYARRTGKPLWIVSEDMEGDVARAVQGNNNIVARTLIYGMPW